MMSGKKTDEQMRKLFLERFSDDGKQTLGRLFVRDINGNDFFRGVSIELTWRDNERKVSCIPIGSYQIRKAFSEHYGEHLDVLNVYGRSGIKIHAANFSRQLFGCIAPGILHTHIDADGLKDVTSSRFALDEILNRLPAESHLIISDWKKLNT